MRDFAVTPSGVNEPDNAADDLLHNPAPAAAVDLIEPKSPLPARPQWLLLLLWIASVLVAVSVTLLISNAGLQRVQIDPQRVGATQVARLSADPGAEIPGVFTLGEADAQVFSEFHGLRVLVTSSGYATSPNDECILVLSSTEYARATADSYSGPSFTGCAANAFPAAVAFKVDGNLPEELRRAYPEKAALQFVFDDSGSDVVVFSSTD